MALTTFTKFCNHHHDFQYFSLPQTEISYIRDLFCDWLSGNFFQLKEMRSPKLSFFFSLNMRHMLGSILPSRCLLFISFFLPNLACSVEEVARPSRGGKDIVLSRAYEELCLWAPAVISKSTQFLGEHR